jgi:pyruvate-formate lyase-activating enzyme
MEEILPHVDHLEFYGGEPFMVKEHVRIFEILARKNVACSIYVNTNAVSFHPRARQFLETLNFKTIAVSMDAVDPELHGEVRRGLRSDVFFENFEYLMSLRAKRGIDVMLNVTEHRKNWFELPQVFRFAEEKKVYLHINTCIHPHNVTLYTLPSDELAYVLDYLKTQKAVLSATYRRWSNASSYDFLLSLVESELASRGPGWKPSLTNLNLASDGHLAAPRPGVAPFETPDAVTAEVARIERMVNVRTAARLLAEMRARLGPLAAGGAQWRTVLARVEQQLADVSHRLVPA